MEAEHQQRLLKGPIRKESIKQDMRNVFGELGSVKEEGHGEEAGEIFV